MPAEGRVMTFPENAEAKIAPGGYVQPSRLPLTTSIEQAAADEVGASSRAISGWGRTLPLSVDQATHGGSCALEDLRWQLRP